jgi:hypothetical protein
MTDNQKWTPGPWKATRSLPQEGADVWWITACTFPNGEKELATVCGPDCFEPNAHLIAAAPELYEALLQALDAINLAWPPGYGNPAVTLEKIHKALAKACGEDVS